MAKSIDMSVTVGKADIPVDVINNVTGDRYNMTISLAHSGSFGFICDGTGNAASLFERFAR